MTEAVIMTSNIGSQSLDTVDTREREQMERRVTDALRKRFRPEFLNRVDEILIFNALSREDIRSIVDIQVGLLKERPAEKGFDPLYELKQARATGKSCLR